MSQLDRDLEEDLRETYGDGKDIVWRYCHICQTMQEFVELKENVYKSVCKTCQNRESIEQTRFKLVKRPRNA